MDKITEIKENLARRWENSNNLCHPMEIDDYHRSFIEGFDAAMELQLPVQVKLINALRHLVILKKVKDKYGKTETYLDQQPKAWKYAIEVLNEIDPDDKLYV